MSEHGRGELGAGSEAGAEDGHRRARLVSNGTSSFTNGTVVELDWEYVFLGGRTGLYKASPLFISVMPRYPDEVTGISVRVSEPSAYSGTTEKEMMMMLDRGPGCYAGTLYEWESIVENPHQELVVTLQTCSGPFLLQDPISFRHDFLIFLHD